MSPTSSAARCPTTCAATTTTRCCARTTRRWARMPTLSLEDVREGVRRQAFFGVMMAIVSSMLVERTDRGDEMFMVMLAPTQPTRARHRRVGDSARTGRSRSVAAVRGRRGRAPTRCGAAVERELVCRLRRRGAGDRRLVPAGSDSQSELGMDQRAAVRTRHSHRRGERFRACSYPTIPVSYAPTPSNSPTRPRNRCGPTT